MIVELPEWHRFAAGSSPWTPPTSDAGRIVVALAPAAVRRDRWAAALVLDLLDEWAVSGHRVVLADCVLEHPMLHRAVGLPNQEGLADAALFGASVSRVAQAVPGRSFFFVSAGSPSGDPDAVLASPRWGRMKQGFREAGVTLVAFLREGGVGGEALVAEADDVIVLVEEGEEVSAAARAAADKVRAVVGPERAEPAATTVEHPLEPDPDASAVTGIEVAESEVDFGGPDVDLGGVDMTGHEVTEEAMDFGRGEPDLQDAVVGAAADEFSPPDRPSGDVEIGTRSASEAQVAPRRDPPTRGTVRSDPNTRTKLMWVALAVLVLVLIVLWGALR